MPVTDLTREQLRAVDDEVQKALDLVVTLAARLSQFTERLERLEAVAPVQPVTKGKTP
jgi:hypothetical protein